IFFLQIRDKRRTGFTIHLAHGFDSGVAFFHFESKQPPVIFQDVGVIARFSRDERVDERCDAAGIELAVSETRSKHFTGKLADFLVDLHYRKGCSLRSELDRKSTRLNSSHVASSYAVFCLK